MSQENVELVRQSFEQWFVRYEPAWGLLHEDFEVHDHDLIDAREQRGRVGIERWLNDWASAWWEFSMEPEEFIDAGDRVLVVLHVMAKGRNGGVALDRQDAILYELRDGKIVRLDYFNNRDQAVQTAGLAEQAMSDLGLPRSLVTEQVGTTTTEAASAARGGVMYVVVRNYSGQGASELLDLMGQREEDVRNLISGVPGFVSYAAFRTGDGGMTVTICQDKAGTDESSKRAAEWVKENVSTTGNPPTITEGSTVLHFQLLASRSLTAVELEQQGVAQENGRP